MIDNEDIERKARRNVSFIFLQNDCQEILAIRLKANDCSILPLHRVPNSERLNVDTGSRSRLIFGRQLDPKRIMKFSYPYV